MTSQSDTTYTNTSTILSRRFNYETHEDFGCDEVFPDVGNLVFLHSIGDCFGEQVTVQTKDGRKIKGNNVHPTFITTRSRQLLQKGTNIGALLVPKDTGLEFIDFEEDCDVGAIYWIKHGSVNYGIIACDTDKGGSHSIFNLTPYQFRHLPPYIEIPEPDLKMLIDGHKNDPKIWWNLFEPLLGENKEGHKINLKSIRSDHRKIHTFDLDTFHTWRQYSTMED